MTPSDNELDEIIRNLSPWYDITQFTDICEPTPIVEEEDFDLYLPDEEEYRSRNWSEACHWMASEEMFEKLTYNVTLYFVSVLNLGKDTPEDQWRLSTWDGGEHGNVIGLSTF